MTDQLRPGADGALSRCQIEHVTTLLDVRLTPQ